MGTPDVGEDVERGDLGRARRRLCSYIGSTAYDAQVCGQIGDLCVAMKDPFEAGRWYFWSDRESPEAERLVDEFIAAERGAWKRMLTHVPRRVRLASLDAYPRAVRRRLDRLGVREPFVDVRPERAASPASLRDRLHQALAWCTCLVVISGFVTFFLVGVWYVVWGRSNR